MRKPISPAPSDAQAKTAGKGIGQYTGAQSQDDQNKEGRLLLKMVTVEYDQMTPWEQKFCRDLDDNPKRTITGKMLFKLRDIKDKYL